MRRLFLGKVFVIVFTTLFGIQHTLLASLAQSRLFNSQSNPPSLSIIYPSSQASLIQTPNSKTHPLTNEKAIPHINSESLKDLSRSLAPFGRLELPTDNPIYKNQSILIHIQDVHQNTGAQQQISNTLAYLLDNKWISEIHLEGLFDPLDLSNLKSFPNKNNLIEAAQIHMENGKISGSVLGALVAQSNQVKVVGIDDYRLYHANSNAFRNAYPHIELVKKTIQRRQHDLAESKSKILNKELLENDKAILSYRMGSTPLHSHLEYLVGLVPSRTIDTDQFLEASRIELQLDFSRANTERAAHFERLLRNTTDAQKEKLISWMQTYQERQITLPVFFRRLIQLSKETGVSFKSVPRFESYIQYVLLTENINVEALLNDIRQMEESLYANHIHNFDEKRLIDQGHLLALEKKLIGFSLTRPEWEDYKSFKYAANRSSDYGSVHVEAPLRRGQLPHSSVDLSPFENFYRAAVQRDVAMSQRLIEEFQSGKQILAAVSGGFHSLGMEKILKEKNVAVLTFVPRLNQLDKSDPLNSLSLFTQEKAPLDKIFDGEKLFLARPHIPRHAHISIGLLAMSISAWSKAVALPTLKSWFKNVMNWTVLKKETTKNEVRWNISSTQQNRFSVGVHFSGENRPTLPRLSGILLTNSWTISVLLSIFIQSSFIPSHMSQHHGVLLALIAGTRLLVFLSANYHERGHIFKDSLIETWKTVFKSYRGRGLLLNFILGTELVRAAVPNPIKEKDPESNPLWKKIQYGGSLRTAELALLGIVLGSIIQLLLFTSTDPSLILNAGATWSWSLMVINGFLYIGNRLGSSDFLKGPGWALALECGVFGFLGYRNNNERRDIVPIRMATILTMMGGMTQVRGAQAGGGTIHAKMPRNPNLGMMGFFRWFITHPIKTMKLFILSLLGLISINVKLRMDTEGVLPDNEESSFVVETWDRIISLGSKRLNTKRGNLIKRILDTNKILSEIAHLSGYEAVNDYMKAMFHTRYATGSRTALIETHHHQYVNPRYAQVWIARGKTVRRVNRPLSTAIVHNGDFNALLSPLLNPNDPSSAIWPLFAVRRENAEIGQWLNNVLDVKNKTNGDSPKIAGLMDLLITQGMWYASVRASYQMTVAKDLTDKAPTHLNYQTWSHAFERIFVKHLSQLYSDGAKDISHVNTSAVPELIENLEDEIGNTTWGKEITEEDRTNFINTTVHMFLYGDSTYATQLVLGLASEDSTFGLGVDCTLFPRKIITTAKNQPMTVVHDPDHKMYFFASEPAAAKAPVNFEKSKILFLKQNDGEIATVGLNGVEIYSQKHHRNLTEREMNGDPSNPKSKGRWISLKNNPYVTGSKPLPDKKPLQHDLNAIPDDLVEMDHKFENLKERDPHNYKVVEKLYSLLKEIEDDIERDLIHARNTNSVLKRPVTPDIHVIGIENSFYAGREWAKSLKRMFPRLSIRFSEGNEFLEEWQDDDISSDLLGPNTIVVSLSRSGQTFPTYHATRLVKELDELEENILKTVPNEERESVRKNLVADKADIEREKSILSESKLSGMAEEESEKKEESGQAEKNDDLSDDDAELFSKPMAERPPLSVSGSVAYTALKQLAKDREKLLTQKEIEDYLKTLEKKQRVREIFVVNERRDSEMAALLGQEFHADSSPLDTIFATNGTPGSVEAATLTVAKTHHFLTWTLVYLGDRFREENRGTALKFKYTKNDMSRIKSGLHAMSERLIPQLVGIMPRSKQSQIKTPEREILLKVAKTTSQDILENARVTLGISAYVFFSVLFGLSLFSVSLPLLNKFIDTNQIIIIGLTMVVIGIPLINKFFKNKVTARRYLRFWTALISFTLLASAAPVYFLSHGHLQSHHYILIGMDAFFYTFGAWIVTLLLRWNQGRQIFARIGGNRSVLLIEDGGNIDYLYVFLGKLFSLSPGYLAIKPRRGTAKKVLQEESHNLARGDLVFAAGPDGRRRSRKIKARQRATIMAARQIWATMNAIFKSGPRIIYFSANPNSEKFDLNVTFPSDERAIDLDNQTDNYDSVSMFLEERVDSLVRLTGIYVFLYELQRRVAGFPGLYWDPHTQNYAWIHTTASPYSPPAKNTTAAPRPIEKMANQILEFSNQGESTIWVGKGISSHLVAMVYDPDKLPTEIRQQVAVKGNESPSITEDVKLDSKQENAPPIKHKDAKKNIKDEKAKEYKSDKKIKNGNEPIMSGKGYRGIKKLWINFLFSLSAASLIFLQGHTDSAVNKTTDEIVNHVDDGSKEPVTSVQQQETNIIETFEPIIQNTNTVIKSTLEQAKAYMKKLRLKQEIEKLELQRKSSSVIDNKIQELRNEIDKSIKYREQEFGSNDFIVKNRRQYGYIHPIDFQVLFPESSDKTLPATIDNLNNTRSLTELSIDELEIFNGEWSLPNKNWVRFSRKTNRGVDEPLSIPSNSMVLPQRDESTGETILFKVFVGEKGIPILEKNLRAKIGLTQNTDYYDKALVETQEAYDEVENAELPLPLKSFTPEELDSWIRTMDQGEPIPPPANNTNETVSAKTSIPSSGNTNWDEFEKTFRSMTFPMNLTTLDTDLRKVSPKTLNDFWEDENGSPPIQKLTALLFFALTTTSKKSKRIKIERAWDDNKSIASAKTKALIFHAGENKRKLEDDHQNFLQLLNRWKDVPNPQGHMDVLIVSHSSRAAKLFSTSLIKNLVSQAGINLTVVENYQILNNRRTESYVRSAMMLAIELRPELTPHIQKILNQNYDSAEIGQISQQPGRYDVDPELARILYDLIDTEEGFIWISRRKVHQKMNNLISTLINA